MNARQAVEENKLIVNQIIERAYRVSKVKNITPIEALAYGLEVEMKYAKTGSQKAGIDIRYDEAKKIMTA